MTDPLHYIHQTKVRQLYSTCGAIAIALSSSVAWNVPVSLKQVFVPTGAVIGMIGLALKESAKEGREVLCFASAAGVEGARRSLTNRFNPDHKDYVVNTNENRSEIQPIFPPQGQKFGDLAIAIQEHLFSERKIPTEFYYSRDGFRKIYLALKPVKGSGVKMKTLISEDTSLEAKAALDCDENIGIYQQGAASVFSIPKPKSEWIFPHVKDHPDLLTRRTDPVTLLVGITEESRPVEWRLKDDPGGLFGGTTGGGKTQGLKLALVSGMKRYSPEQFQIAIADLKGIHFSERWTQIPHYSPLFPLAKGVDELPDFIDAVLAEIKRRKTLFQECEANDIFVYNSIPEVSNLPEILIGIDEIQKISEDSDLNEKESQLYWKKIKDAAKNGRVYGIYFGVTTQKPTVDAIPSGVKANLNFMAAFRTANTSDSQYMIKAPDAFYLLGKGDMIAHCSTYSMARCQALFVPENQDELEAFLGFELQSLPTHEQSEKPAFNSEVDRLNRLFEMEAEKPEIKINLDKQEEPKTEEFDFNLSDAFLIQLAVLFQSQESVSVRDLQNSPLNKRMAYRGNALRSQDIIQLLRDYQEQGLILLCSFRYPKGQPSIKCNPAMAFESQINRLTGTLSPEIVLTALSVKEI